MSAKVFNHKLIELPQAERIDGFYQTPDGRFPSVTTVVGWKKNQFFAKWRAENPKEAVRTRNRGTKLHSLIESYILNKFEEKEKDPYTLDLFNQIQIQIDKIDNVRSIEGFLWSKPLRLAGRVDCIAEYDGELAVIDFKTSTKIKPEEWIENYFVQEMFYAAAYYELTNIPIKKLITLMVTPEGEVKVFDKRNKGDYIKLLVRYIKEFVSNNTKQDGE